MSPDCDCVLKGFCGSYVGRHVDNVILIMRKIGL